MCCWHHRGYHRDWPERCYPRRYEDRSGPSPDEVYVRRLEEERELLERRLQRLEQELEALRRQTRASPE